jgi:DNA gyrase subunit B
LNAAMDNAALHVNPEAPALSGIALETLAKEHIAVENIIARLSSRYDEVVLRAISKLDAVTENDVENLDALEAWSEKLSIALPKSTGDRAEDNNVGSYTAELDRGDGDGEGVRIGITRIQHGIGATRYLPREFFGSNEYRHISALSAKLSGLLGNGAYVQRGERKAEVEVFAEAVDWLMSEARRGQSIQRYKGLGEMNPDQLWDTTVNPETRRLMQVRVEDAVKADEIFTTLMGDQVEPRREFIEKNALTVANLDV